MKRLCADDSGRTSVKVGHRQALIAQNPRKYPLRGFCFMGRHRIGDGYTGTMLIVWPLGYDFRRTTPLPKPVLGTAYPFLLQTTSLGLSRGGRSLRMLPGLES